MWQIWGFSGKKWSGVGWIAGGTGEEIVELFIWIRKLDLYVIGVQIKMYWELENAYL